MHHLFNNTSISCDRKESDRDNIKQRTELISGNSHNILLSGLWNFSLQYYIRLTLASGCFVSQHLDNRRHVWCKFGTKRND